MVEKKIETNKETIKETLVVNELPQEAVREVNTPEGKTYSLVTPSEAITEILWIVREMKKVLLK